MKLYDYDGSLMRNVIFIGDSYQVGTGNNNTSFLSYIKSLYRDEYGEIFNVQTGGYGFGVQGKQFISLLRNVGKTIEDKSRITEIVVTGGYNDHAALSGVWPGIKEFMEEVKATYPNATVYLAPVGWSKTTNVTTRRNLLSAIEGWCHAGVRYGAKVIGNITTLFRDPTLFSSDGFHPNDEGQIQLAQYLNVALQTGTCNIVRLNRNAEIIPTSAFASNVCDIYSWDRNGTCAVTHSWPNNTVTKRQITVKCTGLPADSIEIGSLNKCLSYGTAIESGNVSPNGANCNVIMKLHNNDLWVNVPCYMYIRHGKLYMSAHRVPDGPGGYQTLTITALSIPPFEIVTENFFG